MICLSCNAEVEMTGAKHAETVIKNPILAVPDSLVENSYLGIYEDPLFDTGRP